MANTTKKSETASLEAYRVALENVTAQEQIAGKMLELGYDETVLTEGRNLLKETLEKYQLNKKEDAERSDTFDRFTSLWGEIDEDYRLHRKKVRVIFKKDPALLEKLGADRQTPDPYVKWVQVLKKFYGVLEVDAELQKKVNRLKVSLADIQAALHKIEVLEKARADYMKEKGESQDATQIKNAIFDRMDTWMSEFYAVARIALEDSPQLLEALSKTVKN